MEEFLNKLYNYEYFGTYLMIAIAVLVLLFIIVLFFGKKDKKKREIEETKKLQQINSQDAFKEENNAASVEVPNEVVQEPTMTQEKLENDTIIVPNINNLAVDNNDIDSNEIPEPILPSENQDNIEINIDEPIVNDEQPVEPVNEPILDKIEEKPFVFNDQPDNVSETSEPEPVFTMPEEETKAPATAFADVPDFNFDEIISGVEEIKEEEKNISKPAEVFSSVYVPEKEPVELPKVEESKPQLDDLDIELPTLKKEVEEEKIEKPELKDYDFDSITGEDYNINK